MLLDEDKMEALDWILAYQEQCNQMNFYFQSEGNFDFDFLNN